MKASELIKRLQELVDEHGDVDVHICDEDGNTDSPYINPPNEYRNIVTLSYYTSG